MINEEIMPKVYKEVYEILKYIPKSEFNKIPKDLINLIKQKMDKNYEYYVDCEDFQNQQMMHETQVILAIFFRDYWATEKQKKIISDYEKSKEIEYQEKQREKYNPDDVLKNRQKQYELNNNNILNINIKNDNTNNNEKKEIVVYKETFIQKIIRFFKNIFSRSK